MKTFEKRTTAISIRLALTVSMIAVSGALSVGVYQLVKAWAESIYASEEVNLLLSFSAQMMVLLAPAAVGLVCVVVLESVVDAVYFFFNFNGGYKRVLTLATKQQKPIIIEG